MAKKRNNKKGTNTNGGAAEEGNRASEESNRPAPEESVPAVEESSGGPTEDSRLGSIERFQLRLTTAGDRAVDRIIDFIYCFMYCFRKFRIGLYHTSIAVLFLLKVVCHIWSILLLNQLYLYVLTVSFGLTFEFPVGEIVDNLNYIIKHTIHYYKLFILASTCIIFLDHCVNWDRDRKKILRELYVLCFSQMCMSFLAQTDKPFSEAVNTAMFIMVYSRTIFEMTLCTNEDIRESISSNAVWWFWYSHAVSLILMSFFLKSYDILKWTEWLSKYVDSLVWSA